MVRQRQHLDPLVSSGEPRWYVVRSMHGSIIESRQLPLGVDLKRVFLVAMLEWLDAGWTLTEFSSASAAFFCVRHPERRMISIDPTNPHDVPMYGGAHLGSGPRSAG
jgi:hypothetical protein